MGALAFQYAALLQVGALSDGAEIAVVHNDAKRELDGAELEDMRGMFMDLLTETWRGGGRQGSRGGGVCSAVGRPIVCGARLG